MAKQTPTFAANDRIQHSVYGLGTITQLDENYTVIAFDEHGSKKFVTSMVVLAKSDAPAPAKPARGSSKKKSSSSK